MCKTVEKRALPRNTLMSLPSQSIDAISLWLHARNYAGLAWRQRYTHLVNLLLLIIFVGLLVLFSGQSINFSGLLNQLKAPAPMTASAFVINAHVIATRKPRTISSSGMHGKP